MCCSAKPLQQQSSVARENGTVLFSVDFRKLSTTEHSAYLRGHVLATSSTLLAICYGKWEQRLSHLLFEGLHLLLHQESLKRLIFI